MTTKEKLSSGNLPVTIQMMRALWPDCSYEEANEDGKRILQSDKEAIFLAKKEQAYVGFIQLNLRYDYVEGTTTSPVAYIEGIYVKPKYQEQGIGQQLVTIGEQWGKEKGAREYASDVELQNANSIAFHNKVGFREANRVVCFAKAIE
jgi:aminoglycoside 6'-N-acetyltransferase I